MDLREAISDFDGKHVEPLEKLLPLCTTEIATLVEIAKEGTRGEQQAATWLLKALLADGREISQELSDRLITDLKEYRHWEAQLHILQSLPYLQFRDPPGLMRELRVMARSEKTLVRAWALNGLVLLADRHSGFRADVTPTLRSALDDEAASVRARLRNATAALSWI